MAPATRNWLSASSIFLRAQGLLEGIRAGRLHSSRVLFYTLSATESVLTARETCPSGQIQHRAATVEFQLNTGSDAGTPDATKEYSDAYRQDIVCQQDARRQMSRES